VETLQQLSPGERALSPRASVIRELYLALFVLFFRLDVRRWPSYANANANGYNGALGISLVETFAALSVLFWFEIVSGYRFGLDSRLGLVALGIFAVYFTNLYFLIDRARGVALEREFACLSRRKRVALLAAAAAIFVASAAVFYLSLGLYQTAFGIAP